jgi:hypothetical protein
MFTRQDRPIAHLGIVLVLCGLLLNACNTLDTTPIRTADLAFKGMELYGWTNELGEWRFALLAGTNRLKTVDEVQSDTMDLASLKQSLCELAVSESVFWMPSAQNEMTGLQVDLPLPTAELAAEIKEQAATCQVNLVMLVNER